MTTLRKLTGLLAIASILSTGLQAQSKNDAIAAYNQGVGLMKTDVGGAISSFEKSIQISEQVGDSAVDLKDKAVAVLPDLYYQQAYKFYADKKLSESIAASKATIQVADKYKNDKTKDKASTLLTQLYVLQGSTYFKNNENDKALIAFDSALLVNPNFSKAILNKALIYRKTDNAPLFTETIDLFIEKAGNDTAQLGQAKKLAIDFFRTSASKANKANKLDDAIKLLITSEKYGQDKDVYYQLANIYNKQKKFEDAASNAQKGLDMEAGAPDAKAKFYYELAVAQAGKGDKENACTNFKSALYGPFLTPAKAQMTNLKCAGAAPAAAATK